MDCRCSCCRFVFRISSCWRNDDLRNDSAVAFSSAVMVLGGTLVYQRVNYGFYLQPTNRHRVQRPRASAGRFLLCAQHGRNSCGCKSHRELITTSEAKRNCMRATECGEEAWREA